MAHAITYLRKRHSKLKVQVISFNNFILIVYNLMDHKKLLTMYGLTINFNNLLILENIKKEKIK